ncbi:MAG: hypothetical protein IPJ13_00815 [Saprospiraceae bacterium]|nr:hypothetical protein [Saprospiraceae bacterium]
MSHEIRTPLNAIIGMIRELGREELTPKQNSMLVIARRPQDTCSLLLIIFWIYQRSKQAN